MPISFRLPDRSRNPKQKKPRTNVAAKIDTTLRVEGRVDQYGDFWLSISRGDASAMVKLSDLIQNEKAVYLSLAAQGLRIIGNSSKRLLAAAAEQAVFTKSIYAIDRLGWHGRSYILPGARRPTKLAGEPVAMDLANVMQPRWDRAGSLADWQKEVIRLAEGQDLLTFALAAAFAPLIAHLFPEIENTVLEFCGGNSIGKTSILHLVSSVFGSSAFMQTWRTTVNALEQTIAGYADALLPLNELNLFLDGSKPRLQRSKETIFNFTDGGTKRRFNAGIAQRYRLWVISTTNTSSLDLLADVVDQETLGALRVRLISIPADAGADYGIFNTLPDGCPSPADGVAELKQLATENCGWAARAFISRLRKAMREDKAPDDPISLLNEWRAEFKRKVGITGDDGPANRIADKVALIYAAGRLAWWLGVLPLNGIGKAVLAIYRRYVASQPAQPERPALSAHEEVTAYVQTNRAKLFDIEANRFPNLTLHELDDAAGFVVRKGNSTCLAIRSRKWKEVFGARSNRMLRELKAKDLLWSTEGYECQVKVRRNRPKDRMYCVRIGSSQH